MINTLGWQTIRNDIAITYKALNNLIPYISELLLLMSKTHNRTLRSTSNASLAAPGSKTALVDGSFWCTTPRLWNQLLEATQNASYSSCFKAQVKQFMFNERLLIIPGKFNRFHKLINSHLLVFTSRFINETKCCQMFMFLYACSKLTYECNESFYKG